MGLFVCKRLFIAAPLSYNRNERLKSRKLIEELFSSGKNVSFYPLKVLFQFTDIATQPLLQGGVSVGSKRFKKAVDRNRIKRLIREAYRVQKIPLQTQLALQNRRLIVFFIYTGKELPLYAQIHTSMAEVIRRLLDFTAKTWRNE